MSVAGTSENGSEEVEINSSESWENAKAYASMLGSIPSSFSTLIRSLVMDQFKNKRQYSYSTKAQAVRILKGPSMKSMFFYGCKTFHEDALGENRFYALKDLILLYQPFDLAVTIAMSYLYRRCRALCNEEDWAELSEVLQSEVEIGGYLGQAVPKVGFGGGVLVGGIRHVALSTFLHHDIKGFKAYQRHLKNENLEVDVAFEAARWDCTSLQVATVLLQAMGFGIELAESFVAGLDPTVPLEKVTEDGHYRTRITRVWIDSLLETDDQPTISMRGDYYPLEDAREKLIGQVRSIKASGTKCGWLQKTKEDVSEELTPQLFKNADHGEGSAAPSQEPASTGEALASTQYPPELLEAFSEEELSQMLPEEINELMKELAEMEEE